MEQDGWMPVEHLNGLLWMLERAECKGMADEVEVSFNCTTGLLDRSCRCILIP